MVAGLNAQLRLVRRGNLKLTFLPVISWLESHAKPALTLHGVRINLAWFQSTAFGYSQFGLIVNAADSGNSTVGGIDGSMKIDLVPR